MLAHITELRGEYMLCCCCCVPLLSIFLFNQEENYITCWQRLFFCVCERPLVDIGREQPPLLVRALFFSHLSLCSVACFTIAFAYKIIENIDKLSTVDCARSQYIYIWIYRHGTDHRNKWENLLLYTIYGLLAVVVGRSLCSLWCRRHCEFCLCFHRYGAFH